MSGRGGKRRGRPPKTPATAEKKYQLLKKPKYLQNDSRFSTPSASRASSPQDSEESSRKSFNKEGAKKRGRPPTKNKRGASTSYASRRSYNSPTYNKTDYHYGSDFGDSSEKSEDEMAMSQSDSAESFNNESDSDFSLSSYSNAGPTSSQTRSVTPEPVWIKDDIEIPPLELPKSSEDLMVPKQYVLRSLGIFEVLRRYRNLVRLSPFRPEDFCAALVSDEQSALLTEIHIALIKAILREEDSQQTHFGPLDQKDSINISLYLIDTVTWPEVLRIYVESDPSFSPQVLDILSTKEYPYTEIDDRLTVLQFLTDQFLTTTFVRDDLIQEGPIHYDDHCRVCHRLGNLLCCETCPAVYHLECVDPPLEDVPSEDWQCNICKSHSVSGVNDCISTQEKQGLLCRHEHFGFDRHARKYWFVCRRLFVETEDGSETWYYSTESQFDHVFKKLDPEFFEKQIYKEIDDVREDIIKQMKLTESLTNEHKGNKKSYFEIEHEKLTKESTASENGVSTDGENNNETAAMDVEQNLDSVEIDKNDQTHLTRSRTNQISNGTFFFKLGMENAHKEYFNQFTTNPLALNKPQKNEERDKKRHLSHKFSLTEASQFKWGGLLNGSQASLIAVFKQTLLTFETSITSTFMHCNWPKLRKNWINAVAAAATPHDFLKVLMTLQSCFKNVIYANVWHEQLGHIHLYRITSNEREERKKIEKREKREESEEERNRLAYNYVKYSLGLRHQVWKQKGEEYRIHGQWGWLWTSKSRKSHFRHNKPMSRIQCVNVVVRHEEKQKVLSLKRQAYENLDLILGYSRQAQIAEDDDDVKALQEGCEALKEVDVETEVETSFGTIDVSEALKAKTRVVYSKIGKRSTLDDLLERRENLRDKELKVKESTDGTPEIPENVIPVPETINSKKRPTGSTVCIQKLIQDITDNKARTTQKPKNTEVTEKCIEVNKLMLELQNVRKTLNIHRCFSEQCRNATETPSIVTSRGATKCFSALCLKELQLKNEIAKIIQLLKDKYTGVGKKGSILHQKLAEAKNNDLLDILNKYQLGDYMCDEYYDYNLETCLSDVTSALSEAVDYESTLISNFTTKTEPKMEVDENGEPEPAIKTEEKEVKDEKDQDYVRQPNRRFTAVAKPAKKESEVEKELDADGNEKIYSATATAGRIYLKKLDKLPIPAVTTSQNGQTAVPAPVAIAPKYPEITTHSTVKGSKSILVLSKFELDKCARRAGKYYTIGFNHQAKNNNSVWPYPCTRPFFRTCWIYRTLCSNSFAALGLQLRVIWTCLRWDDMQTKPMTADGKNQVTNETEIVTTELLKHRNVGQFMDATQYFRRRVVIPLELPKTVREVTSIRSGLRKRKRAESPQQTDPQVNEEWIDEDKLELWEIRQYIEKQDRVNIIPTTRTSTGKLPLPRQFEVADSSNRITVTQRISTGDAKEKIEQQLRLQREANNKKRAEDLKQGQPQFKTIIRKMVIRNPDGTTRIVNETTTQVPTKPDQPQKIQVMRGPDGKMSVRGLQANQKLVQTSDGKYLILPANHATGNKVISQGAIRVPVSTATSSPIQQPPQKVLIRSVQPKTIISANNVVKLSSDSSTSTIQSTSSLPTQRIITSSGQVITQQMQGNIITSANLQQLLQRGNVTPGQKIVVQSGPGGVQKLLVSSPSQQQVQQQTGEKRIIIQNASGQQQQYILQNQNNSPQPQQQIVTIGGQKLILQTSGTPTQMQQIKTVTSPVQQTQQIQFQIQESPQQQQQQQIVVQSNGSNIAQQMAQGKIQVMNLNGQQVLVKSVGNNQSVIVGQVKTSTAQVTPVKQTIQPTMVTSTPNQIVKTVQIPSLVTSSDSGINEQAMLANHPPGTIVKCVTAQVMQTPSGPRIVLQGLQGSDISPQQSAVLQQQVKQQLMKAQESSGKPGGAIGPTKIYLAITPQQQQSQPPPLTPVLHNQLNDESVAAQESVEPEADVSGTEGNADEKSEGFVVTQEYIQNTIKNVLRQGNLNPEIEEKLLTLQRYQEKQAKGEPFDPTAYPSAYTTRGAATTRPSAGSGYDSTIDSDEFDDDNSASSFKGSKKRGANEDDDDEWVLDTPRKYIKKADREKSERKKEPCTNYMAEVKKQIIEDKSTKVIVKTTDTGQIRKNIIFCNRADVQSPGQNTFSVVSSSGESEKSPEKALLASKLKMKAAQKISISEDQVKHHKIQVGTTVSSSSPRVTSRLSLQAQLLKHKESLKKIILKKRDTLEKELQNEIQKELSAEMAIHIKNICAKQESIVDKKEPSKYMKKKMERLAIEAQQREHQGPESPDVERPKYEKPQQKGLKKPCKIMGLNTSNDKDDKKSKKKQKLYCVCRTPYDKSKFYIGCDLCNNWYHGNCVGISEEASKEMTDFVCTECERAKDTQELFCLCRTPYDQAQFYICCDKCQDWFHGKCVGILQSEAEFIDEYICPNCQKNNSINFANMKTLTGDNFDDLHEFLREVQSHKSAWPFIDPVDASEVPDYYKVVKEPMDLKQIESKVNNQDYACLADFIKDMTKIFDNCRYYNHRDSTFCKCAEELEAFFIQKLNSFRDILVKT